MHPDKTFLGRIKKGFDFLGVHFSDTPKISKTSQENHRVKLARRYAQGARVACIGAYKARWTSWCRSVLNSCIEKDVIKQAQGRLALKLVVALAQLKENTYEHSKTDRHAQILFG